MKMKADKRKRKNLIYNVIIIILLCIMGYSMYQIGTTLWGYYAGTKEYNKAASVAGIENADGDSVDFEQLQKINQDVKGWIICKGAGINYPIVQGASNDTYLYHMFNGKYNRKGSIFIDYRVQAPLDDFMTIIYGHNMKDKSMFSHLMDYKNQKFYEKNKKMKVFTPGGKYYLEIFSALFVDAASPQYKLSFNDFEKSSYIEWAKSSSAISTDVEVTPEDKIVMLSTCTNVDEDGRFIVLGKLVPRN